jgi:transcriptional regulator with PAS, ATPase and Fis domain
MQPLNKKIKISDILDASTNAVMVVDSDKCITYGNRMIREQFELNWDGCVGKPVGKLIPELEKGATACIQSGDTQIGIQLRLNGKNVIANISPIVKQGQIIAASISLKHKEEYERLAKLLDAYRLQNKLLETIFGASTDGLWIINSEGIVVAWNPAAESITGFKAKEIVGKKYCVGHIQTRRSSHRRGH